METRNVIILCVVIILICLSTCFGAYYLVTNNSNNQTQINNTSNANNSSNLTSNISNNTSVVKDSSSSNSNVDPDNIVRYDENGEPLQTLDGFCGNHNPDDYVEGETDSQGNPITYRQAYHLACQDPYE